MIFPSLLIIAQAAPPASDPSVPGSVVVALVTAIITALGSGFVGKQMGRKEAEEKRTVGPQPFRVQEHREPTWAEIVALEKRMDVVERRVEDLSKEQIAQWKEQTEKAEERTNRVLKAVRESADRIYTKMDTLIADVREERAEGDAALQISINDLNHRIGRAEGKALS